jgi:hypothetical protein
MDDHHFWLNLPMDDHHFGYIFLTLTESQKKITKKKLALLLLILIQACLSHVPL